MSKDYFGELEEDEKPAIQSRFINYEGQRFIKWLVVKKMRQGMYLCRCDCGFEAIKPISSLKGVKSTQCQKCYRNSIDYTIFKRKCSKGYK